MLPFTNIKPLIGYCVNFSIHWIFSYTFMTEYRFSFAIRRDKYILISNLSRKLCFVLHTLSRLFSGDLRYFLLFSSLSFLFVLFSFQDLESELLSSLTSTLCQSTTFLSELTLQSSRPLFPGHFHTNIKYYYWLLLDICICIKIKMWLHIAISNENNLLKRNLLVAHLFYSKEAKKFSLFCWFTSNMSDCDIYPAPISFRACERKIDLFYASDIRCPKILRLHKLKDNRKIIFAAPAEAGIGRLDNQSSSISNLIISLRDSWALRYIQ